jgi:BRCT domain type II-containing protein
MNIEALLNNQVIIIILLLLFVSSIGLIAYFLQNKVPFFKQPEEKVDRETAVREEVERVIVKLDQRTFETVQPLKSDVKSKKKSPKPVAKKASSSKKKNAKSKS